MKLHRGKSKQMQEMEVNIEGGRRGKHEYVGEGQKIHHLMRIHENYAKVYFTWTRSACAVSLSRSWFLEPAASLIRDSCSY